MRFRYLGETVVAPRGQVNLLVPGEPVGWPQLAGCGCVLTGIVLISRR